MTVAWDTETGLIEPGLLAPPLVCISVARHDGKYAGISELRHQAESDVLEWFRELLINQDKLIGLNVAYDFAVVCEKWPELLQLVFQAYDEDRVCDVGLDQRLIDNAHGALNGYTDGYGRFHEYRYGLADLELRYFKRDRSADKGPDAWRLRYIELIDVPLEKWPKEAYRYPIEDAEGTLGVWVAQRPEERLLVDSPAQARAAWALHLMTAWGIKTNPESIAKFQKDTEARYYELTKILKEAGLVKVKGTKKAPKDTRDTKAAKARMQEVMLEFGEEPKLTDTGELSLDADACEESGDELLQMYAERTSLQTVVTSHIPALLKGVDTPIQARFNVIVDTGRTSCSMGKPKNKKAPPPPTNGYQLQNVRRLPGIRECFESRPGTNYGDVDFTGLELCTVAQVCNIVIGYSNLGDAINAGLDPHLDLGAQILGISYEEALSRKRDPEVKNARQLAKIANFGYPGGLGAHGFIKFARTNGIRLSEDEAKDLKQQWLTRWTEFEAYFKWVRDLVAEKDVADITQLFSERVRGMCSYTVICNSLFQGLGADGAKAALYAVSRACYSQPESPLYGARPVNFIHDQVLCEIEEERAHEGALEQGRLMVEACNRFLPDVPTKAQPALSKRWTKDCEAVFHAPPKDGGRLVPWDIAKDNRDRVFDIDGKQVQWK